MARRKKKKTKPRIYVELTAYWGNDDVDSTIKISRRRWKQIQEGAEYEDYASYWYEGRRFSVCWEFSNGEVSLFGEEGMECVIGLPVSSLIARISSPSE